MTLQTALAAVAVISALGAMVAAIYKLRPESNKIFVDSAKVSVELADAGRDALRAELAAEKVEHDRYRKDAGAHMTELAAQLRSEKAEKKHCHAEIARLKERIRDLEGGTS